MRREVSGINIRVLRWAREKSGMTLEEVARALKKDIRVVADWEAGTSAPTFVELEELAYRLYKRPTALFFFPEPPEEPDPEHSFRTLPDFEIRNLTADTRYRVRAARALQLSLAELADNANPSPRKIFRDLSSPLERPLSEVAAEAREYIGISLETQKQTWKTQEEALKAWRQAVEEVGVFVFKHSFKQRDVSGFSLYNDELPVIMLNNSNAFTRQTFTLFHELAHILVHIDGVTKRDDSYIAALVGQPKEIEVFCNAFAAEFLVPNEDLQRAVAHLPVDAETIAKVAQTYKVSREVILRRLRDAGLVTTSFYERLTREWLRDYEETKGGDGGNYYATQATYLSQRYMWLAFRRYYEGRISMDELAEYLDVKVPSVPGIEQAFLGRAA